MKRTFTGYLQVPGQEREKLMNNNYARLAEYENFYLYAKIKDDKVLYRECFSKFDIDGVTKRNATRRPYLGKAHRGAV